MYPTMDDEELDAKIRAMMRKDKMIWFATGFLLPVIGVYVSIIRMRLMKAPKPVRKMAGKYAAFGTYAVLLVCFFVIKPLFFG